MACTSSPIAAVATPPPERNDTQGLPDEILSFMFVLLTPTECNASLTYAQWKETDASMRHRLSLDAHAALGYTVQRIFARFMAVAKLMLRCVRGSGKDSLSDDGAR
uniref:Uncharacterized protein n=1 Tax=Oryza meridionalis TaxID=40149 RepID=A0A0E0CZ14_9ORYZ